MIKLPFSQSSFAREMKPRISGANLTLEYENVESSLSKIAVNLAEIISQKAYDAIVKAYEDTTEKETIKEAIDYLQRAMLHFMMYEHRIFLQVRVSNDGITVKKNDDETTAFKYLQDELDSKNITTAWFWINRLIKLMNDNPDDFPDWADSSQKKDTDDLPVSLSDFNKWVGVADTGGEYFMISAAWIIREVWLDCVKSRFIIPLSFGEERGERSDAIVRALCYEVMGRACERLAYQILPEPIRKDIDNEMGKNHKEKADTYIRENVSKKFLSKADTYWNAVDMKIKQEAIAAQNKTAAAQPIIGETRQSENDKFIFV